ncbi:MAG: hypothetical protein J7L73_08085 [Anaerolineales bacterium]|nr:hypothetical protein [Anaerolineales bacterium]
MVINPLRWVLRNLGALVLAFVMAVIVWVSAVTSNDPNQERVYVVPIEIIGQNPDMALIGEVPEEAKLKLYAPQSILDQIDRSSGALRAWVDLSGFEPGTHVVPINNEVKKGLRPVRILEMDPESISLTLEYIVSRTMQIKTKVVGEPALGYQAEEPIWDQTEVTITGRSTLVDEIVSVEATLDINNAAETIEKTISLSPLDSNNNLITGVTLVPEKIKIVQPITLLGGYRNVVVRVVTSGQVADGYRTTNITPSPLSVLVFSDNPQLVEQIPGYVETQPLDIAGATDDIETILPLNLPEGITVVGDPNVLVQVGVAALQNSVTISRQVEVIGLVPGFAASVAPEVVDVIIYGSVPVINKLTQVDVRVVVDLTGLENGVYQLTPAVEILPEGIRKEAIMPETVEVTISTMETPTPKPFSDITPTPTE